MNKIALIIGFIAFCTIVVNGIYSTFTIIDEINKLNQKITNLQNQEVRIFPSDEDCAVRLMYFRDGNDQILEPEKMLCCWHMSEKRNIKETK